MKAYPQYKSSGIDWLGEIPSHWDVSCFKYNFDTSTGITFTKTDLTQSGNEVISYGQIHSSDNIGTFISSQLIKHIPDSFVIGKEHCLVDVGNFIFADTSEDLEGCGNCVYVDRPVYAGYHTIQAKQTKENSGKFLSYLFLTNSWRSQIRERVYGIKVFSITQNILNSTYLLLPPYDEQEAIAGYLDEMTEKIDALIAEKRGQVEDLRKYRTSLITETVTHGLNPDAPLRPSGIDWLGDIPKHWMLSKAKYYIEIKSGDALSKDEIFTDGQIPVYGGGEIIGYTNKYNTEKGDIIIGRVGARCGCVRIAEVDSWATDNALIVATNQNPYYLYRLFEAANLNRLNESNAQPLITATKVKDLNISLPPITEQQDIADYLDEKTAKIDALIEELEAQLSDLATYKQAVITEAVTGKVDVRDWTPKN